MESSKPATRSKQASPSLIPASPLFRDLDGAQLAILQQMHGWRKRAKPDAELVRIGEPAAPVVTVLDGWAFRCSVLPDGQRQVLSIALPGDTIGLDTLLTGGPVYPVQAGHDVAYATIAHHRAQQAVREDAWFRDLAHLALQRERAEAERALIRMSNCDADQALGSILLDFYQRLNGRGLAAGGQFRLALSPQQLADYVGVTTDHLDDTLDRLRCRGLVSVSGGIVTVSSLPELERFALLPPGPP